MAYMNYGGLARMADSKAATQQQGLQCMIGDGTAAVSDGGDVLPVATSTSEPRPEFVSDVERPK